jgi:alpha-tubulin suppressor-like RCC1 family protein
VKSIDEFVPVPTLENVQFQTIACGWFHTLALTTSNIPNEMKYISLSFESSKFVYSHFSSDGTLWGWGRNEKYTLAQSEPNACLPMKLNTNLRFKKIAAGLASSV